MHTGSNDEIMHTVQIIMHMHMYSMYNDDKKLKPMTYTVRFEFKNFYCSTLNP